MNNIVLIGMPGSGKSSVGRNLARVLRMNYVDADEKLEADTGRKISDIFEQDGETVFRDIEEQVLAECAKMENTVISTGGGAVLREQNMKRLSENGRIVWLNRSLSDLASTNLSGRPLLAGHQERIYQLFAEREPLYRKYADTTIRNRGTISSILARLLNILPRHLHLAVIGDPIAHTRSPQIHAAMAQKSGFDLCYEACHVTKDGIPEFLKKVNAEGISGFNITIPHKSSIIPYLAGMDEYAASCGAVNTVVVKNGALYGHNTDGDGILGALSRLGTDVKGKRVLLLGAGGAALSICRKCSMSGAAQVAVLCRSPHKAQPMLYAGLKRDPAVLADEMTPEILCRYAKDADIVINATPLGMSGIAEDFTDFSFLDELKKDAVVCDIVYKPAETTLLAECRKRGIRHSNGLPMLIYQAVFAYEYFTDMKVDREAMYDVVLQALTGEEKTE